jgi:hypothetical protein
MVVEVPVGDMANPWPLLRLKPLGGGAEAPCDDLF